MHLPPLKTDDRPVTRLGRTHAAFLKRQYPVDDTNTQVSIAVGIVLGVFLIASDVEGIVIIRLGSPPGARQIARDLRKLHRRHRKVVRERESPRRQNRD
ncbi:hypothetical protein E4U23_003364 [Claviceps purpurea]|nr:hypothetical protein E4U50_007193 [Claviceps purpurea]KAG6255859.1 hypothetical protein E4U23_003364 [Claviceps purpurea]KAG6272066.1 hypothetical protein E4U49_003108 [Claviceps purpurea]